MLQSPHPELQKVPGKMLADVLSMVLHANTGKMSSVTRRSAGLPLIVKAVLVSENKNKQVIWNSF